MPLLFSHGLEGSPEGRKPSFLRGLGYSVIAPDGRKADLAKRVALLEQAHRETDLKLLLIGSSYGGLAAAIVAQRFPHRFCGLVLCAPALEWVEPPVQPNMPICIPPSLPTIVIHGRKDRVIPLEHSHRLHERCPHVQLWEQDDDHRLADSMHALQQAVFSLFGPPMELGSDSTR